MIKAMLQAAAAICTGPLGFRTEEVGIRPGDNGAPKGAYRGQGWYVGIYFGGMTNAPNQEMTAREKIVTLGIDVTRVLVRVPTKRAGDFVLAPDELIQRAEDIDDAFLAGDSIITTACNDALIPFAVGECFYEDFNDGTFSAPRIESPDWLLQEPSPDCAPIWVLSLRFTGMKYVKPLRGTTT